MSIKSIDLRYHFLYWLLVIVILAMAFGRSWGSPLAAAYFISMLLPVVLGTSYFFNFVLVPQFYIRGKTGKFILYSLYLIIVSLYLKVIVLILAFVYLGHFEFDQLDANASDTILLSVVFYLLVALGSIILMVSQIKVNRSTIEQLHEEKRQGQIEFLDIRSNRQELRLPIKEIRYIESLSDYIRVHTAKEEYVSKEAISRIAERLPPLFLRIHRSFIVNQNFVLGHTYSKVTLKDKTSLNIGRTYQASVKDALSTDRNRSTEA